MNVKRGTEDIEEKEKLMYWLKGNGIVCGASRVRDRERKRE